MAERQWRIVFEPDELLKAFGKNKGYGIEGKQEKQRKVQHM